MNVIVVMSDSFRRDHIGAFGNPWIKTPALDRFAAQSVVFPEFRIGSYPTIPQRTDMFTGRYSFADRPWQPLKKDDVVLTELLSRAGIETYMAADTPHLFRSAQMTFTRGFDGVHWSRGSEGDFWWTDYYDELAYEPPTGKGQIRLSERAFRRMVSQGRRRVSEMDWTTPQTFQTAIEWLTRNSRRKSFFLYVDTFDPHEPWDPPVWARDLYLPDAQGVPYAWAEYGSIDRFGKKELKHLQALYAAECTMVDRWFGRLVDTVDLLGIADKTMVVFLSDHGHYLGYPCDGGLIGKLTTFRTNTRGADGEQFLPLLDTVSRPVFMARIPGRAPRTCTALAQPPDVMPTILDFFRVRSPKTIQGQSLLPQLGGRGQGFRSAAVSGWYGNHAQITDGRWLYGISNRQFAPRLFDSHADPRQTRDVMRKFPAVARRLHRRMIAELKQLHAPAEWIAALDEKEGMLR